MDNLLIEKRKLELIKKEFQELIDDYEQKVEYVKKEYKNDPFLQANLLSQFYTKLALIKKYINSPYFGRIDFQENGQDNKEICYIGKVGVFDKSGKIITVDWRAPISSLFYDSNIGPTEYLSPLGVIKGNLDLKRQFDIKNGELINFQDVNTVSDDELLKPYLSANADNRLKNIVATIQKEQNQIIRKYLNENLIVQGTAGSGKTTVALHRIAYLVYNEQKNYQENQFIVIGPNAYFMDYISSVLPDLDVNAVTQYTFLDVVNNFLNEKIKINEQNSRLEDILKGRKLSKNIKYKTSLKYKDAILKFVQNIESSILHGPIVYKGIELASEKEISNFLIKKNLGISERIKEFNKYFKNKIKENADEIKHQYWLKLRDEFLELPKDNPRRQEILEDSENFNKEVSKLDKVAIEYFKDFSLKPLSLYKLFINNAHKYIDENDCNIDLLKEETMAGINKKTLSYEDLPAVIYLNLLFNGYQNYDKYIHVVIDEAQDFGLFHFFVLKSLFKNSTFSIFGDLAQSIYSYQSISNWNEVINDVFQNDCDLLELEKSYRTTYEIMESANLISKYFGFGNSKAVLRHGDEVETFQMTPKDIKEYIINILATLKEKGFESIAIICKDEEETLFLAKILNKLNININCITNKNVKYNGGICLVPSYLAKGLEFDAVIIYNVDSYDINNELDMKLLYVAMTRALHKLEITYNDHLIEPLKDLTHNYLDVRKI